MDPGSFFILLIVAVVVIAGGIAYVVLGGTIAASEDTDTADGSRPRHNEVTSVYHEHTDLLAGRHEPVAEPERSSAGREHQSPTR
ncbi:MAG: hypothetical protein JHC95_04535 [Solirubrobacteraceae bacterium]|nr:hypothetical protein [Solirubrobacteraceae bacterium]